MEEYNKYVRFDWAAKRMLRDKANFGVFEGLITVLLNEPVHIVEILESEANQEQQDDKFNRVDIKAKNSKDEIIIVEIQLTRELYYLERVLYGVAKAITEHISLGEKYDKVKKVYSISILYFDLGKGADYLYHGTTSFTGVHTNDTLQINSRDRELIRMKTPEQIFPEYFLIRVNEFDKVARTPLEEWLDYLKNGHIKEDTTAPGLREAREKLQYLMMSKAERQAYDRHIDDIMVQNDVLDTAKREGLAEGLAIGKAEGRAESMAEAARKLKLLGTPAQVISQVTGLSVDEIAAL
ncbi:MAG: Rpn family recombination-promoting nuclease/putative transposase [Prevotella sp.]|nr:Rpn family recombination-promoting nuclease/putative transposase [Prevotella sp.]